MIGSCEHISPITAKCVYLNIMDHSNCWKYKSFTVFTGWLLTFTPVPFCDGCVRWVYQNFSLKTARLPVDARNCVHKKEGLNETKSCRLSKQECVQIKTRHFSFLLYFSGSHWFPYFPPCHKLDIRSPDTCML